MSNKSIELYNVARYQRYTNLAILLNICAIPFVFAFTYGMGYFFGEAGAVISTIVANCISLAFAIAFIIIIVRLRRALGDGIAMQILSAILMIVPCLNVLVLLFASQSATSALRKSGIRVGIMGASKADIEQLRVTHQSPPTP